MKKLFFLFSFCGALFSAKSQQTIINNFTVCAGTTTIISPNVGGLINPTYSLMPGQIASSGSTFVINPTKANSVFTVFVTGLNSQSVSITKMVIFNFSVTPSNTLSLQLTQATCGSTFVTVNSTVTSWSSSQPTITWSPIPNSIAGSSATYSVPYPSPLTVTLSSTDYLGCVTSATALIQEAPPTPTFTLNNLTGTYSITCQHPAINLAASSNYSYYGNILNYFWASSTATFNTNTINVTSPGNYTLVVSDPLTNCANSQVVGIGINTLTPTSVFTPSFQNITCNLTSIASVTTLSSPSVNITQNIMSPLGGTYTALSYTTSYLPMSPGIYTYCVINNINGCSTCKTFTVASNQGFPTFSVTSVNNFSLGCNTKSVDVINFINGNTSPAGGPTSYTLLNPGSASTTPSGPLSLFTTYTVNIPGTYTAVIKDNSSQCESRVPFTVIMNTVAPNISAIVPIQILNCTNVSTTLTGQSLTQNVSYSWYFAGSPGNLPGNVITVSSNTASPTQTLVNTYTLTITDNSSTCRSSSVIPIFQNTFRPRALINSGMTNPALTCLHPTLILTNVSTTGIPSSIGFPTNQPVIGYNWSGPSPQTPLQNGSTYLATVPGVYTLVAKDLNNGCTSQTTAIVSDNRIYPSVSSTPGPFTISCPGNFVTISPIINGPLTGLTYSWTAPSNATTTGVINSPTLITNTPGTYTLAVTNTLTSCTTTVTLAVFACVGLEDNSNSNSFIYTYPNPGNGIYTLVTDNYNTEQHLEIYNANGKLIKSQILTPETNIIDLQQESNGIYLLRVTQGFKLLHSGKIVKE